MFLFFFSLGSPLLFFFSGHAGTLRHPSQPGSILWLSDVRCPPLCGVALCPLPLSLLGMDRIGIPFYFLPTEETVHTLWAVCFPG